MTKFKLFANKHFMKYIEVTEDNEIYISVNLLFNETALYINWNFFILIGDFRKEIEEINDLQEIKDFFKKNFDKISGLSDNFILLD
jgi:hypothetical protein